MAHGSDMSQKGGGCSDTHVAPQSREGWRIGHGRTTAHEPREVEDQDPFFMTAHHTRFAVLDYPRTAHHTRSAVLNTAICFGSTSLAPPENGAGKFSGPKKCQHFPGKKCSRVVQVETK
jgi:hypothetical protein